MTEKSDHQHFFQYVTRNKLKDVSNAQIESAVARAISDLVGTKYTCRIEKVCYDSDVSRSSKLEITLSEYRDSGFEASDGKTGGGGA